MSRPPLPPADRRGCILRTRVSRERRRLVRRAFVLPATLLLIGLVAFVALGIVRPDAGALVPEAFEAFTDGLPGPLSGLSVLQVTLLPFLVIGAWQTGRGMRYARRTWDAQLTVTDDGRLEQRDGVVERIELDYLIDVDVAPNRAFTELNERAPVGSLFSIRLTDATGATVDVNPGMWFEEQAVTDIIRHYVHDSTARVSSDAAARYGMPQRSGTGAVPLGEGTTADGEPELEAPLRQLGIEVQRAPEIEPKGLDDEE